MAKIDLTFVEMYNNMLLRLNISFNERIINRKITESLEV